MKKKLAIFDIDGTIFRSSLLIELFYALVNKGIFPARAKDDVEPSYTAWLNRKGTYNDYLLNLVRVHYACQKGCLKKDIDPVIRTLIGWQKDRVYRYTRHLIATLKRKGYFLIAISNSQDYMVSKFAKALGFDAAIGRVLEVKNGRYTGRVMSEDAFIRIDEHIDKVRILQNFLQKNKIAADMKRSIAIGDSEGDIPLLNMVGQPIAFNPSSALARLARRKGWKTVVERKDVIYDITHCSFIAQAEDRA